MNNIPTENRSLEDRIDILFRELELAIKWQQPSILFATFDTQDAHEVAETVLEKRLIALDQTVPKIKLENSEIAFWLSESDNLEKTVFFVEGVNRGNNENGFNAYSALDILQDFFIENRIRIVFWLTEEQAIDLAHFAPDFWSFRHRVVEFEGLSMPKRAELQELDTQDQKTNSDRPTQNSQDTHIDFHDLLINELPEGEESIAILLNLLLTLGILHWRQGNHEKAHRFLDTALSNGKTLRDKYFEAECLNAIALVYTSMDKVDEAIEAYHKAIRLAPDQTIPWNNLGNLYIKHDHYDDAIEAFKMAIEQSPEDAVSWNGLGNAYRKKGQTDDAVSAYKKAVELAPTFGYPWNSLGDVFTLKGQVDEAIAAYQKAIEINGYNACPWINLGRIFLQENRKEEAIQAYQKAVEIEPNNILALGELEEIRKRESGTDDSTEKECEVIALEEDARSDTDIPSQEGLSISEPTNQSQTASAFFGNAVVEPENNHHDEKSSTEWNELGHEYLKAGKYDEAINAYINAIEQWEDFNWSYINNLALAHYQKGKQKANTSEDPAHSRNPEGSEIAEEVHEGKPDPNSMEDEMVGMDSSQTESAQPIVDTISGGFDYLPNDWPEALDDPGIKMQLDVQPSTNQSNAIMVDSSTPDHGHPPRFIKPENVNENDAIQEDARYGLDQLKGAPTASLEIQNYDIHKALRKFGDQDKNLDPLEVGPEDVASGKNPKTAFEWNELGNILMKSGAHQKAIAAYIRAIELSPKFGWSYSNLAFAYCQQGKYTDAVPLYKKSIELFKNDKEKAISWNRLGDVYRRLKDRKRAKEAYQMAAKLDSDTDTLITRTRFSLLSNTSS